MTTNIWTKVGVSVQTVLATAKTITGITKASPAVASSTAHGFTNGQEVLLKIAGMSELNNMVVRAANVAANTFELEGVDSTLFGTFTSGTAQLITFGASAATFQDINGSGGEPDDVDLTTIHNDTKIVQPGLLSALSYSFSSLWDPGDAALIELNKAHITKTERAVKLSFASGAKIYFNSFVAAPLFAAGSAGAAVTTPVSFKIQGNIKSYAT
jgi:hypothetical protein